MKDKDITQKVLEKYNDVFADILNVLLFNGRDVVEESTLTDALPMSMLKIDGRVRSQERDIAKYWRKSKINVALFGLENQTTPNKLMPLRVLGYDGAEYVKQSRKENIDKAKYPVITLVLYLGYEKEWNYPKTLFEVLDIDEDIKPYVNDFKINLFKSDFRILADYLYQMRVNKDYIADETTIEHVEELLTLMSVMTGDNRFEETINDLKGKEKINMCEVLDRVEARGIEKGIEQGIEQGVKRGTINTLISLVNDGILSSYEAALRANMSVEDFEKYLKKN